VDHLLIMLVVEVDGAAQLAAGAALVAAVLVLVERAQLTEPLQLQIQVVVEVAGLILGTVALVALAL
jgi:hypothetical protein